MGSGLRYSPLRWFKDKRTFTFGGDKMAAGVGITSGTGTICKHSVTRVDGIFKTTILIDLTGLNGCSTAGDIIGKDGGTVNCHIGQITKAVNGTIIAGWIECHETPAGGNADINLYSAKEGTGAQDTAIGTSLTETALCDCGAHSAGSTDVLSGWPAADEYLYLTVGAATDADYTAGRLLITLWGY
jgi:hypothetical protein